METWAWFSFGSFPRAGGIDDQVEKDLQIIMLIEAIKQERQKTA
jgi:hypothetical protein